MSAATTTNRDHALDVGHNRRLIYGDIAEKLKSLCDADMKAAPSLRNLSAVWSHAVQFSTPETFVAPSGSHLRVEWMGVIVASILIRLGDCRIGFLLPRHEGFKYEILDAVYPYPLSATTPQRIIRQLNDAITLVDFVFYGERLGSFALTESALLGDPRSMELLADGLAQETTHLRSSLIHQLAQAGVFLGVGQSSDLSPVVFSTPASVDATKLLDVTPAQISLVGQDGQSGKVWMVLVGETGRDEILRQIEQFGTIQTL